MINNRMGAKIRSLRKARNLSQDVLAQYLGVSFQAVSKWENGTAMPDVAMIPAIASFFDVSTDELFDFNRIEQEQKIQQQCWDIEDWREREPERAETAYRELLKQYPGNEIILANLLYVLQTRQKHEELISLCKTMIETTKDDATRYDAARILAETYKKTGEYGLCKNAIDLIPEFFFTHREEKAMLLEGEDMFRPAWQQKCQSLETLIRMTMRIADYYEANNEREKAVHQLRQAKAMIDLQKDDIVPPFWTSSIYEYPLKELLDMIERRLNKE